MAQDSGGASSQAAERHQAEAARLRAEVEELVRQARRLLGHQGDQPNRGAARPPPAPGPAHPKRAERERELEDALEKADWYRREIKRLRHELESRDHVGGGPNNPLDRDPMEVQNLLAEKRKELQRLRRSGEALDRMAEVQRRAEAAQSTLRPEVEEKLNHIKREVEQQKRLNVKLQADRLKLSFQRKAAEEEVRSAGSQLRSQAAQLQRPPRPTAGSGGDPSPAAAQPHLGGAEPPVIRQLRRDVDILQAALQQDERRFRAAQKEDGGEVDFAAEQVAGLKEAIAEREAELAKLRARRGSAAGQGGAPLRPRPAELLSPGYSQSNAGTEEPVQGSASSASGVADATAEAAQAAEEDAEQGGAEEESQSWDAAHL